jgi:hypothetical protein
MTGRQSIQPLFSQGTVALVELWRSLQNVVGTTLKIDVIVLYMFLLQITLYNFYTFTLNDPCVKLPSFFLC